MAVSGLEEPGIHLWRRMRELGPGGSQETGIPQSNGLSGLTEVMIKCRHRSCEPSGKFGLACHSLQGEPSPQGCRSEKSRTQRPRDAGILNSIGAQNERLSTRRLSAYRNLVGDFQVTNERSRNVQTKNAKKKGGNTIELETRPIMRPL